MFLTPHMPLLNVYYRCNSGQDKRPTYCEKLLEQIQGEREREEEEVAFESSLPCLIRTHSVIHSFTHSIELTAGTK